MNDAAGPAGDSTATAGTLLRNARKAQGLHIAALAAQIKVTPQKLEALESDRVDQLPDATFARALAQTVCRQLRIDPEPVLARLPAPPSHQIVHLARGPAAPFRDRPGREAPRESSLLARPVVWGPLLILVAAALVYLLPAQWLKPAATPAVPASAPAPGPVTTPAGRPAAATADTSTTSPPTATPAPDAAAAAAKPLVEAMQTAPPAAGIASAPAPEALLVLRPKADSWVEVIDARGQSLLSRTVRSGETVRLDGTAPFRLRIGNASEMQLTFRGEPVDLSRSTRAHNIARLELK